jgi:uncharacterized protein YbjQ (UPF0145 family)
VKIPAAADAKLAAASFLERRMSIPYKGSHIRHDWITTALELPGHRIVSNIGLVRGIVVRSRSVVGTFAAGLQTLMGGNITLWSSMCEKAREDSYLIMIQHAQELGANAIIAMRYDATEVSAGVTEVLAYGTAVVVEPNA